MIGPSWPLRGAAEKWWEVNAAAFECAGILTHLTSVYVTILASSCGDVAEANADIEAHGATIFVKTISGDNMPRVNPACDRRNEAFKLIQEMGRRLNLSPMDDANLQKTRRAGKFAPKAAELSNPQKDPAPLSPEEEADAADWHRLCAPRAVTQ